MLALLIITIPQYGWCDKTLSVEVIGPEGSALRNILARLRIARYSEESELTEQEIRRLHNLAPQDIKEALRPFGYYSATVNGSIEQQESMWLARYEVIPGDPVRVSSFSLTFAGEATDLEAFTDSRELFELSVGDILRQPLYEQGKRALLRKMRSLGYLDAAFTTHEIRIDLDKKEAEINLVLDPGALYLFGETISEQTVITDALLSRYLSFEAGEPFNRSKLLRTQRDLNRTEFFSSVFVEGRTDAPDGNSIPVLIRVEPRETYNRYSIGVGYDTDIGAQALFEWKNRLLNRYGHRASLSVQYGERERYVLADYRIPVNDPRHNSVVLTGLLNQETWEDTTTKLYSVSTAYEYSTPKVNQAVSIEIREEDYRVGNTTGKSQLFMPAVLGSWAFADDVVNTTNGLRASVYLSGSSEDFISDAAFLNARGDARLIITPLERWRIIGRGSLGGIIVDSIEDIPPSLRYYAGGANSVRGYRYKSLGPQDSSGTVIGGTFLLTGSIALEHAIGNLLRVSAFFDIGNAMDDLKVDLAQGVGMGVGIALPFGQIRMEVAYPLSDEGTEQYFYLTVGADL